VGSIVERIVSERLDAERFEGLRALGVDEFSYRKRHRYVSVVVDHDRRRVVWAARGHSAEVLGAFFEQLGPERCAAIEWVTIDMAGGYRKAIEQWLPHAEIVYDRFHVQRLASDALDEVRRAIVRELGGAEAGREVKGMRYVLLKNYGDLSSWERSRLSTVQDTNRRLYRAYLLKETLAQALDYRQPWRARRALKQWLAWASRSKLPPFVKLARTIRKHLEGIVAYIRTRLTNGLVEGLNTKLRMVARRAFGFHSPQALISMLFLHCGGIQLNPPLPTRR
jgi:transposase